MGIIPGQQWAQIHQIFDPNNQMMVAKENSARLLNALMGWGRFDLTGARQTLIRIWKGLH